MIGAIGQAQDVNVSGAISPPGGPLFPFSAPSWVVPGTISVGTTSSTQGAISASNGGLVQSGGLIVHVGQTDFSTGSTLESSAGATYGTTGFSQGTFLSGSTLDVSGSLSLTTSSTGFSLLIFQASDLEVSSTIRTGVAGRGILVADSGSTLSSHSLHVGLESGGDGEVSIDDGSGTGSSRLDVTGATLIGLDGKGTLNAGNSSIVNSGWAWIGLGSGSEGAVNLADGANWTVGADLNVGGSGTGSLQIESGATVNARDFTVGASVSGQGDATVTGAGSEINASARFSVGWQGDGSSDLDTLQILDGAHVSSGWTWIGYHGGSNGFVEMSGADSRWDTTLDFNVGGFGKGEVSLVGGTISASYGTIGFGENSEGLITVSGNDSLLEIDNGFVIGSSGTGELSLKDGGAFTASGVNLGFSAGSSGTLRLNSSASATVTTDFRIGVSGNGLLEIKGGSTFSSGSGLIGANTGGTGEVLVSGAGSRWEVNSALVVGLLGGGEMTVESGGVVENAMGFIGYSSDGDGEVFLRDSGSSWAITDELSVGEFGTGAVTVENGASLQSGSAVIGAVGGSNGEVVLRDSDSMWSVTDTLTIGELGTGGLLVENGARVESGAGLIGAGVSGEGSVTLSGMGAHWAVTDDLGVGDEGMATLRLEDGATAESDRLYVGLTAGGSGSVEIDGIGSSLVTEHAYLAYEGTGHTMDVTNGGHFQTTGNLAIGESIGSEGTLTISDSGSLVEVGGALVAGFSGQSTIEVTNGGSLETSGQAAIGVHHDGSSVTITGPGSSWTGTLDLAVGNFGDAELTIADGGHVEIMELSVGNQRISDSHVTVTGSGSSLEVDGTIHLGPFGRGELRILDGATATSAAALIGNQGGDASGFARVSGTGSSWTGLEGMVAGAEDIGQVEVLDGGLLESERILLGQYAGSEGSLRVGGTGSLVDGVDFTTVGENATGNLTVEDGAHYSGTQTQVALSIGSSGDLVVNGTGSLFEMSEGVEIGVRGAGSATIENAGRAESDTFAVAVESGGTGDLEVRGNGSRWDTATSGSVIGLGGHGTLTLVEGGIFSSAGGSGNLWLGALAGSEGTLNIGGIAGGPAEAAGLLEASALIGGDGTATLRFNHLSALANPYHFTHDGTAAGTAIDIVGSVEVLQEAGTTFFGTSRSFTGGTRIEGGRLITDHATALGSGPLDLNGGEFQPLQSVAVDTFRWSDGTVHMELGNGAPTIAVANDFLETGTSAGTFDLQFDGVTPLQQRYRLVDFGGTTNFSASDFSGAFDPGIPNVTVQHDYQLESDALWLDLSAEATGPILQNSAPVLIPTFADFLVNGRVTTGTATESNVIRSLAFDSESSLEISNTLSVSTGNLDVANGSARIDGDFLATPHSFQKRGAGELVLGLDFATQNDLLLQDGTITATAIGTVGGSLQAAPGTRLELGGTIRAQESVRFQSDSQGIIDGTLVSPHTRFAAGSRFEGNGSIIGHVFLDGTVAPGRSIGTLAVSGDFTMSRSGSFELEVAGPRSFDRLVVGETARLGGTLDVQPGSGYRYRHGQRFGFLAADDLSETFDSIELAAGTGYRGRFVYHATTGIGELLILNRSYVPFATNANQVSVARALDRWIGIETGDIGTVTLALDYLEKAWFPYAFDQILPHYQASILELEIEGAHEDLRQLSRFLSSPVPASHRHAPLWNAWTLTSGAFGDYATPGRSDFNSGSILSGIDYAVASDSSIGLLVGFREGSGDIATDGSLRLESTRFGVYARHNDPEGLHLHGAVAFGDVAQDFLRPIRFPGLERMTSGSSDGQGLSALLGGGYDFSLGEWNMGPEISLQYSQARFSDHHETGAGVLDLAYREPGTDSLRSYLGLRLSRDVAVFPTLSLVPALHASWRREYLEGDDFLTSLDAGDGPTFVYQIERNGGDILELGTSIGVHGKDNRYLGLHYRALFDSEEVNHVIGLGASIPLGKFPRN